MISTINSSTSFKGIYAVNKTPFSKSQLKTIENIKTTLGDKKESMDFFVSHGFKKNSVFLSKVIGLKPVGVGVDSNDVTWKNEYEIGTYNEKHPFKIEDLKKADKNQRSDFLWKISLFALPIIGFLFCLLANPKATIGYEPKAKTELVQKADTLMQKADSLKNNIIKNVK